MATLYADNFTDYTAGSPSSLTRNGWISNSTSFPDTASTYQIRTGINALENRDTYTTRRAISTTQNTVFISFAFLINVLPTSPTEWSEVGGFLDASLGVILNLRIYGTGEYGVESNGSIYSSSGAGITALNWYWVQLKVVINDSTGSVELRDANGTVLVNQTSIDTKPGANAYPSFVRLGMSISAAAAPIVYVTDLHVWDNSGSVCNTFTEPTQIDNLYPNGAGALTEWTPSTGNNWECVDEVPQSLTDYVETSGGNDGDTDLYEFTNLSDTPDEIYGVVTTVLCRKTNAGPGQLKLLTRSGSTTLASPDKVLPDGEYTGIYHVEETDPNTGLQWSAGGVNSAQFGYEVETA